MHITTKFRGEITYQSYKEEYEKAKMLSMRDDIIIVIASSILFWVPSGAKTNKQTKNIVLSTSSYLFDESKPILREKKRQTESQWERKEMETCISSWVINYKWTYQMRLYTENNRQCIFDPNYLPNTDKIRDITFKFNLMKVVVQEIS